MEEATKSSVAKRVVAIGAIVGALAVGVPSAAQAAPSAPLAAPMQESAGNCGRSVFLAGVGVASFLGGTVMLFATPFTGGASTVGAIGLYEASALTFPFALDDARDNC